jgi:hypothetical protein
MLGPTRPPQFFGLAAKSGDAPKRPHQLTRRSANDLWPEYPYGQVKMGTKMALERWPRVGAQAALCVCGSVGDVRFGLTFHSPLHLPTLFTAQLSPHLFAVLHSRMAK